MKIWFSPRYGTSNISSSFKNYEEKNKFLKQRTDPEMISLIEEFKKKYNDKIKNLDLAGIERFFGLEKEFEFGFKYIPTDKTPDIVKKIFKKLEEVNISNTGFFSLQVEEISGTKIRFNEYDGAEFIEKYNDMEWFLV